MNLHASWHNKQVPGDSHDESPNPDHVSAVSPAGGASVETDGLDKTSEFKAAQKSLNSLVWACVRNVAFAMGKDYVMPNVNATISASGEVSNLIVTPRGNINEQALACMKARAADVRFPRSGGEIQLDIINYRGGADAGALGAPQFVRIGKQ
jgi:hypothetical protein